MRNWADLVFLRQVRIQAVKKVLHLYTKKPNILCSIKAFTFSAGNIYCCMNCFTFSRICWPFLLCWNNSPVLLGCVSLVKDVLKNKVQVHKSNQVFPILIQNPSYETKYSKWSTSSGVSKTGITFLWMSVCSSWKI